MKPAAALALALAVLAGLGLGLWGAWALGNASGRSAVQAEWDAAKQREEVARGQDRKAADALAAGLRKQLRDLGKKYEHYDFTAANAAPVECPASGRAGDLVLPAAVIDGMFHDAVPAPGPGASRPN